VSELSHGIKTGIRGQYKTKLLSLKIFEKLHGIVSANMINCAL